jgi:hypothetical protein
MSTTQRHDLRGSPAHGATTMTVLLPEEARGRIAGPISPRSAGTTASGSPE